MRYYITLLFRGLLQPRKVAQGLASSFRNRKTEIFIISYPKSGRTWLRVLVNRSLQKTAAVADRELLRTYKITQRANCHPTQFSHDGLCNLYNYDPYDKLSFREKLYESKKVIFLKRDIRDVLVSHYFEETKRMKTFSGTLSEFMRHEVFGARKIVEFTNLWYRHRHIPSSFQVISYEDLHKDPHEVLRNVLKTLRAPTLPDSQIDEAIEYSRFENLRKRELANEFKSSRMAPSNPSDGNSFKTRKGKMGGFRDSMSDEDIRFVESEVRQYGDPECDWFFVPEDK